MATLRFQFYGMGMGELNVHLLLIPYLQTVVPYFLLKIISCTCKINECMYCRCWRVGLPCTRLCAHCHRTTYGNHQTLDDTDIDNDNSDIVTAIMNESNVHKTISLLREKWNHNSFLSSYCLLILIFLKCKHRLNRFLVIIMYMFDFWNAFDFAW